MENSTKVKIGLGVFMIGVLGFTAHYLLKQTRALVNTDFELTKTQINKLSLKEVSITLWWRVVNKSDIGIVVSNQVYDIFLNGRFLKKVGSGIPVEVAPLAETMIPTYIVFSPREALLVGVNNFASLLSADGRRNLNLKVTGTMDVKTSVFSVKKFPFEYSDSIQNIMEY
jgi:LEA14-like dessication related protein